MNATIEEFSTGLPHDQPISAPISGRTREVIDYVFQEAHSVDEIMGALEGVAITASSETAEIKEWAEKTKKTILQRSPTSIEVTKLQLQLGKKWSIAETFRYEHQIAARFMRHPDFVEGVSSLLIRKPRTTPEWQPAAGSKVPQKDVESFFSATPVLRLLKNNEDYTTYPHAWTGLPTEMEVGAYVKRANGPSKRSVIKHFVDKSSGKVGVSEKVSEIIDRKTEARDDGAGIKWREE